MKHPFKLSKTNIIYFIIAALLWFVFKIRILNPSLETISELCGNIMALFLFPFLTAILFWFLFRKKKNSAPIAFNVMLSFILLSKGIAFMECSRVNESEMQKTIDNLNTYKSKSIQNPDSINSNYEEFYKNSISSLDALIEKTNGEEKEIFKTLKEIAATNDSMNVIWQKAHLDIENKVRLNFMDAKDKLYCEQQLELISDYLIASKSYKEYFIKRPAYIDKKFKKFNGSRLAKDAIKGFNSKFKGQLNAFIPYIEAHIEYGSELQGIFSILKNEKWTYSEQSGLHFSYTAADEAFNELYFKLPETRSKVNSLLEDFYKAL
jgi:hypothetical protein